MRLFITPNFSFTLSQTPSLVPCPEPHTYIPHYKPSFFKIHPNGLVSYHLLLDHRSFLLLLQFPTTTLYEFPICPERATCDDHLILFDFIITTPRGSQCVDMPSSLSQIEKFNSNCKLASTRTHLFILHMSRVFTGTNL
jgi:hypothetical protein